MATPTEHKWQIDNETRTTKIYFCKPSVSSVQLRDSTIHTALRKGVERANRITQWVAQDHINSSKTNYGRDLFSPGSILMQRALAPRDNANVDYNGSPNLHVVARSSWRGQQSHAHVMTRAHTEADYNAPTKSMQEAFEHRRASRLQHIHIELLTLGDDAHSMARASTMGYKECRWVHPVA
eukprot:1756082-Alexandrium_andersonii.AAC.1